MSSSNSKVGELQDYRRTVIQRPNDNTEVIEEAYQHLDRSNRIELSKDTTGQEKHGSE